MSEAMFTPEQVKRFVEKAIMQTAIKTFIITSIGTFILSYMLFTIIHI